MPTNADLLLDTSAAIARLDPDHAMHADVVRQVAGHGLGLAGHARYETYSVLTRLPAGKRVSPADAHRMIERAFPHSYGLRDSDAWLGRFAASGIAGGSTYDALVAAAALDAGKPLLTCDRRALSTYAALGVTVLKAQSR